MSRQQQNDRRLSKGGRVYRGPGVNLLLGGPLLTALQNLALPVIRTIEVMLLIFALVTALHDQDDLSLEADLLRCRVLTPHIDETLLEPTRRMCWGPPYRRDSLPHLEDRSPY